MATAPSAAPACALAALRSLLPLSAACRPPRSLTCSTTRPPRPPCRTWAHTSYRGRWRRSGCRRPRGSRRSRRPIRAGGTAARRQRKSLCLAQGRRKCVLHVASDCAVKEDSEIRPDVHRCAVHQAGRLESLNAPSSLNHEKGRADSARGVVCVYREPIGVVRTAQKPSAFSDQAVHHNAK